MEFRKNKNDNAKSISDKAHDDKNIRSITSNN